MNIPPRIAEAIFAVYLNLGSRLWDRWGMEVADLDCAAVLEVMEFHPSAPSLRWRCRVPGMEIKVWDTAEWFWNKDRNTTRAMKAMGY